MHKLQLTGPQGQLLEKLIVSSYEYASLVLIVASAYKVTCYMALLCGIRTICSVAKRHQWWLKCLLDQWRLDLCNVLPKIKLRLHVIMKLYNNSTKQSTLYVTTCTVDVLINTNTDMPT